MRKQSASLALRFVRRMFCLTVLLALFLIPWSRIRAQTAAPRVTGMLTVFAAASLTEPFKEIGKELERLYPGLHIIYNFAGSQALRTQLEQGAPADVFASADGPQMALGKQNGVVQGETPIFVQNRLVLIVPANNPGHVKAFCDLAQPGLKLDLAASQVPVGNYSRQAIEKAGEAYGVDFARKVLSNIVSEENNVKQVVLKIQLGEADAGIVYISDVAPTVRQDVLTIPIPDAYNRIASYPIALSKEVQNRVAAGVFIGFVLSEPGQALLKAHNFMPIKDYMVP